MAAGVGKTYRMLQEGHAEAVAGRDVVIGYLEPHERPETSDQARGLEELPRRSVEIRGGATVAEWVEPIPKHVDPAHRTGLTLEFSCKAARMEPSRPTTVRPPCQLQRFVGRPPEGQKHHPRRIG